jgi:hypothetical protein
MYAALAAEARGGTVEALTWEHPEELKTLPFAEWIGWIEEQVRPRLDGVRLLIGKSLGTHTARLAAEHSLPAVWLTPVLTSEAVVEGMRAATAPMLLVGGTGDRMWDGAVARSLSKRVLEVEGADHAMHVPGPLARSAEVLGRVATAVEEFLDGVGYSASATRVSAGM